MTTVFISWSGETSHYVAIQIREWLPSVIQSIEPYVSSEDIEKGRRWSEDVAAKLEQSGFGILCITPESLHSDWMLFEAGALSKIVSNSRVVPLCIGIPKSKIGFPLAQFQMVAPEKADFLRLVKSINSATLLPLDESLINKTFDRWWPDMEATLSNASAATQKSGGIEQDTASATSQFNELAAKLDDLIRVFRGIENIVSDPTKILPENYVNEIFGKTEYMGRERFLGLMRENSELKERMERANHFGDQMIGMLLELHSLIKHLTSKALKVLSSSRDEEAKDVRNMMEILSNEFERILFSSAQMLPRRSPNHQKLMQLLAKVDDIRQ